MNKNIIELHVDGMTCTNCAGSVEKFLHKKGLNKISVNFSTGEVRFEQVNSSKLSEIKTGINRLGFTVLEQGVKQKWWTIERKFYFCLFFTLPLFFQHIFMMIGINPFPILDNFWVQFFICLPVFILGVWHFGTSAFHSIREGFPNMDVLIFIGSTAAFIYSFIGTVLHHHDYIFYETAATIITLVLLGNLIEKRSVQQTTTAIDELGKLQPQNAQKLMPSGTTISIPHQDIKKGDILQVNEGDSIPTDGKIMNGKCTIDESMLTGESLPIEKNQGDKLIGGSTLISGNIQLQVTKIGKETVLQQIIELVKSAQSEKPNIQRLADKISAIFVPIVIGISFLTFTLSFFVFQIPFHNALMNSIAVLVISCPCAMGLATPTAVMVGVGRVAKNGILIKGGQTLESFAQVKNIIFDKTGTLTTGEFTVKALKYFVDQKTMIHSIIYTLEKHSSHPIAQSLTTYFEGTKFFYFKEIEEEKGIGMKGIDADGNIYLFGSRKIMDSNKLDKTFDLYLTKNGKLLAGVDIEDRLKPETTRIITQLKKQNIGVTLLSGDNRIKTESTAKKLGIPQWYAEKMPDEKLNILKNHQEQATTAMVGDGINDAPALASAHVGISLSDASQIAIQSADIVLLKGKLDALIDALNISKATLTTIKQNLFWAFAYNIVAIPIAALGFLNPMWGALFMAFSDVVVIGNSLRLKTKKLE